MEKWMSKGRSSLKADVDFPKNRTKNESTAEKKKVKKWSLGNFLRRKSKNASVVTMSTQTIPVVKPNDNYSRMEPQLKSEIKNGRITCSSSQDSMTSQDINLPLRNGKRNRLKARVQAERDKYKGDSSTDDETTSGLSLLRIHSADSIQSSPKSESYSSKRCRGARTERYMKRLHTNGDNKTDQNSMKSQIKYSSDILRPIGSSVDDFRCYTHRGTPSFGSEFNIPTYKPRLIDGTPHRNMKTRIKSPPEPPPRSFKLHIFPKTMRYSLQNSDIENDVFRNRQYNVNYNSLDRMYTYRDSNQNGNPVHTLQEKPTQFKNVSWSRELEKPLNNVTSNNMKNKTEDKKRHSKNLEEALEELEAIYNSLRLNDEDLLDRAEKRSMDEYRDKLATAVDGSIKSTDSSSSNEMTREVVWSDVGLKNCDNDPRLRDDMAYRRMHQNERPSSVDNYRSISRMSYLTSSPCLSYKDIDCYEKPKSRRGTPDLTRDDVAFRSISHANNTLKILDPQPPFGIPIGPVSTAADSDYLHVEASKDGDCRSLYIPKKEPDVVTDDLAFRSLRKDSRDRSSGNMSFLPKTLFVPEIKKRRAVRSLSADLYGIISEDSKQSSWYKKYIRLNRPLRVSGILEGDNKNLDINGNKPKINYGKIQVHVPQSEDIGDNSTRDKEISSFTDRELEYKELCRELENLITKTSEKVKIVNGDSRRNSLTEFAEWEELLDKNNVNGSNEDPLESNREHQNDETMNNYGDANGFVHTHDESIENASGEVNPSSPPSLSISKTTEPIGSGREPRDGGACSELENIIAKTFENSSESVNDKILIASKDIEFNDCHNHDEILIASINEGEIMDNEYNSEFGHLLKSIMNVCFVTNCLTAYSVAFCSLCLTLLIAIIVAL